MSATCTVSARRYLIDRQLSTMHGAFGFYPINAVTMHLVQFTAYLLALLNLSGLRCTSREPRHAE